MRERFDTLARRRDLPATGNLLISTTPVTTAFGVAEAAALERWLHAGNTLLLLATLSDRPDWALGGFVSGDLRTLAGLEFMPHAAGEPAGESSAKAGAGARHAPRDDAVARAWRDAQELERPQQLVLVPSGESPYFAHVRSALALSDYPPHAWDVKVPRAGFVLTLAQQREGGGVLWVRPSGAGSVIVSGFGSLFTNRALGLTDNAQLLANVVSASVGPGGAVLFDDEHQGLAAAYDPEKFYRDPRLYATLGVLGTVWLIWVLGGTQLRLARTRGRAPREAELVRATGLFLARVLRPARRPAACRTLLSCRATPHARRRCGRGAAMGRLEHHPRLRTADVRQLREWYAAAIRRAGAARPPAQSHRQHGKAACRMSASIRELESLLAGELGRVVIGAQGAVHALSVALDAVVAIGGIVELAPCLSMMRSADSRRRWRTW